MIFDVVLLVVGLVLTLLTGFFVAAEFSLVNLDRSDLEARARNGAKGLAPIIGALKITSTHLSSAQLGEAAVVEEVRAALRDSGLDPQSLILELTETAFLEHTEAVAARLWQLKSLGVQLAVDDFGTGYSSLQHLRRFPIDVLKIAKSFVDGLGGASDESALARAIIDLGGSFQLRVVAEGIETEDQVERLRELGCDLVQGFHFARPLEPAALGELLARGTRATLP